MIIFLKNSEIGWDVNSSGSLRGWACLMIHLAFSGYTTQNGRTDVCRQKRVWRSSDETIIFARTIQER